MLRHPNDELLIERRREQIKGLESLVAFFQQRCLELARELGPEREREEIERMMEEIMKL